MLVGWQLSLGCVPTSPPQVCVSSLSIETRTPQPRYCYEIKSDAWVHYIRWPVFTEPFGNYVSLFFVSPDNNSHVRWCAERAETVGGSCWRRKSFSPLFPSVPPCTIHPF